MNIYLKYNIYIRKNNKYLIKLGKFIFNVIICILNSYVKAKQSPETDTLLLNSLITFSSSINFFFFFVSKKNY